jgi:predicted nucleic acid-binding protein
MKVVFADTYYFLAVGSQRDQGYGRAIQFIENYRGKVLTTEWILVELADALATPSQKSRFLYLTDLISADENWIVIDSSHELYLRGVELFSQRSDKSWSLTDCISFVVMQEHGLTEALTADHHFEQAGFVPLLA